MIYITGDTHGDMSRIVRFCERMETSKEDIMIILGDVGLNYYGDGKDWRIDFIHNGFDFNLYLINLRSKFLNKSDGMF